MAEQHLEALAEANRRRLANAALKRDLAAGKVAPWLVFLGEVRFDVAGRMRVSELLPSCPGIGKTTADKIMRHLNLSSETRLRDLTTKRREAVSASVYARHGDRRASNGRRD